MESIAYYDGKIGAPEELMVPFNDRVHFLAMAATMPPLARTARYTCCRTTWTAFLPAPKHWISTSR